RLNIDTAPPEPTIKTNDFAYTNSNTSFAIPFSDTGAGIDNYGTKVTINGISLESLVNSSESRSLYKIHLPIRDNEVYKVVVSPRDTVGNVGRSFSFNLTTDKTNPILNIFSSSNDHLNSSSFLLSGEAYDNSKVTLDISNNGTKLYSFLLDQEYFSKTIPLVNGKNTILVGSIDQAGNATTKEVIVFSEVLSQNTIITNFGNGPNPFSPNNDKIMSIIFTVDPSYLPASANISIYDLSGTTLWTKGFSADQNNNISWNGINQFGNTVSNGVYPYLLSITGTGGSTMRRGKIIVL
ncbi:MAG: gliding motility-associated C-terminal domain-containing protein, partial [Candidatus Margulisiibacteriota bacterium]